MAEERLIVLVLPRKEKRHPSSNLQITIGIKNLSGSETIFQVQSFFFFSFWNFFLLLSFSINNYGNECDRQCHAKPCQAMPCQPFRFLKGILYFFSVNGPFVLSILSPYFFFFC